MPSESGFISSEYVEYAVIGSHSLLWVFIILSSVFGVTMSDIEQINAGFLVALIPFTIVIGTTVDSLVQRLLSLPRSAIERLTGRKNLLEDERIARLDPVLYAAYEWRMRRARIPGAAAVNWLLLGIMALAMPGILTSEQVRLVALFSFVSSGLSIIAWTSLCQRAYVFRLRVSQQLMTAVPSASTVEVFPIKE